MWIRDRLNISPQQLRYVDNSEPGEGLLIYETVLLHFKNPIPQNKMCIRDRTRCLNGWKQKTRITSLSDSIKNFSYPLAKPVPLS